MKTIRFLLLSLFGVSSILFSYAQELPVDKSTRKITFEGVVDIDWANQQQLYVRALAWFQSHLKRDIDVITVNDLAKGQFVAKGTSEAFTYNTRDPEIKFSMSVTVKNGSFVYVISDLIYSDNQGSKFPLENFPEEWTGKDEVYKDVSEIFRDKISSLTDWMTEKPTEPIKLESGSDIDGFWGMRFGSNQESVRKIMQSKAGYEIMYPATADRIIYTGGSFGGRDVALLSLDFVDGLFYQALIVFQSDLESRVIPTYRKIKAELTEKYNTPKVDTERYSYPYEKGDGHTETAIRLGKATFGALWVFSSGNTIGLTIGSKMGIALTYFDGALNSIAEQRQKAKDMSDY